MPRALPSAVLVLAAATLAACELDDRPAPGEELPLEPVEVTDVVDAEIDLSSDEKGPRIEEGVSGLLPADFPRDLPLFAPSSLVDYGSGGGGRFLLLAAGRSAAEVRSKQLASARAAGWSVAEEGGGWRLGRGGRSVRLEIRDAGGATELRFEY